MTRSSIALIANGHCTLSVEQERDLKKISVLMAVDGGIHHCIKLGLIPTIYVGDLDSASEQDLSHFPKIKTYIYAKEKDKTDLQLAIELALESHDFLQVFGALGGRIDHSLFNLILLTRFPEKIEFLSKEETVFLIKGQKQMPVSPDTIISLMPINGPVYGVTTRGLKWELKDAKLNKHFTSLSNLSLGPEIFISVGTGDLLCILIH